MSVVFQTKTMVQLHPLHHPNVVPALSLSYDVFGVNLIKSQLFLTGITCRYNLFLSFISLSLGLFSTHPNKKERLILSYKNQRITFVHDSTKLEVFQKIDFNQPQKLNLLFLPLPFFFLKPQHSILQYRLALHHAPPARVPKAKIVKVVWQIVRDVVQGVLGGQTPPSET